MKISIVVPVYNAENFLKKSIGSVLSQTNPNWELILVNDGSTDRSAEICDYYSQKYKNIFAYHKENEGQFLTRQFGIEKSSGDYIGFLDADDYLAQDYISDIISHINESGFPDVVCFGFIECNGTTKREKNVPNKNNSSEVTEKNEVINDIIEDKISGAMWSKVFKSKFIKNTYIDSGYVKTKKFGEDAFHSFSLILAANSVSYLNKTLYYYIRNDQGASLGYEFRDFDYFNTKYVFELLDKSIKAMKTNNEKTIMKLYAHNFNDSIYYLLKYYRSSKSLKRKIDCIKYDWTTYLLCSDIEKLAVNPYVRKSYLKVYKAFLKKRYITIFIKEKTGW